MDRLEMCDVWADNLDSEMALIRDLVEFYPYIGMDTEFPGVVARPIDHSNSESLYAMRMVANPKQIFHELISNLEFEMNCLCFGGVSDDMYAPDSIELLQTSGLNFKRHEEQGIDPEYFGELLISSGLVLLEDVKWISFHSGYDFGYILKMVTLVNMPVSETEFFDLLKTCCKSLRGGLNEVAKDLNVARKREGTSSGSDSLLTADTFFALRSQYFDNELDDGKFLGQIYASQSIRSRHRTPPVAPSSSVIRRQVLPPRHHLTNPQEPGPRASSAVSIKNPNAPNGSDNSTVLFRPPHHLSTPVHSSSPRREVEDRPVFIPRQVSMPIPP
ncbi:hypothetical protein H4Q26_015727 [Puccinia striiformis f. sp. tritici PST-130]|nr:hypothetical protein H4Q26_015727 [Puccinia striiformis f. sp. tritici PST-130]